MKNDIQMKCYISLIFLVIITKSHSEESPTGDRRETLKFDQPTYIMGYIVIGDNASDTYVDTYGRTITVTNHTDANVSFNDGAYSDYFEIVNGTVQAQTLLPPEILARESDILLSLRASLEGYEDGFASILINLLQQKNYTVPLRFEKTLYNANFTDGIVVLDDVIKITPADIFTPNFTLLPPYDAYFDFKYDASETDQQIITIGNDLLDVINEKQEILLQIKATHSLYVLSDITVVALKLPFTNSETIIKFSNAFYTFTYNIEENGTATATGQNIGFLEPEANILVSLSGSYSDNFVVKNGANADYSIQVQQPLNQSELGDEPYIALTLTASSDDYQDGVATAIINLPRKVVLNSPHFSSALYSATYYNNSSNKTNATVILEGKVEVTADDVNINADDVSITVIPPYDKYFDFTYDEFQQITVRNPLDPDLINGKQEILLQLQATFSDASTETAVVAVKLFENAIDASKVPRFKKSEYIVTYRITDKSVILDEPIEIVNVPDISEITIKINGEFASYFNMTFHNTNWEINRLQDLPPNVINDDVAIFLNITASYHDLTINTMLVVLLPKKQSSSTFYFSKSAYMGVYNKGDPDTVQISDSIIVDGTLNNETEFIAPDYPDYFSVSRESSKIFVKLLQDLPSDVLKNNTVLFVRIEASSGNDSIVVETTTLVVQLPRSENQSDEHEGTLIAVIAVLSVLLVGAILGSAVFYFLKFRRGDNPYKRRYS